MMSTPQTSPPPGPDKHNGLSAEVFVQLRSIDRGSTDLILQTLREHSVAAYVAADGDDVGASWTQLWVDQSQRSLALDLVNQVTGRIPSLRLQLDAAEVDQRFADIMGSFDTVSEVPDRPERPAAEPPPAPTFGPASTWRTGTGPTILDADDIDDPDDHFTPPTPPPVRRPTRRTALGILGMLVGVLLLVYPSIIGLQRTPGLVIGVICMGAGLLTLLMQLRTGPDTDDGARV